MLPIASSVVSGLFMWLQILMQVCPACEFAVDILVNNAGTAHSGLVSDIASAIVDDPATASTIKTTMVCALKLVTSYLC